MSDERSDEKKEEVPDIYCDGVKMALTPYDVMLFLQRRPPMMGKAEPVDVGTIRMSLEHAKVLAIILRKNLKGYEDETGKIPMHPELLKQLGISKDEDW